MVDLSIRPPTATVYRDATRARQGMTCLIATEGILFVYLIFSYAYLASQSVGAWPPTGAPKLSLAAPNTVLLVASSLVLEWGMRRFRRDASRATLQVAAGLTLVMGAAFVAVQILEWRSQPFGLKANAYSAIYYVTTGVHMAHVVAGLAALAALLAWSASGRLSVASPRLASGAIYWHFVDVVWLVVFATFYLVPRL